jgi:hypothetical protein
MHIVNFKKYRYLLPKIWVVILLAVISIAVFIPIMPNALSSQSRSPNITKTYQSKDIQLIYQALADDIIQIFKWMEIPKIDPPELALRILGYQDERDRVFLPIDPIYRGLPSFKNEKYIGLRSDPKNANFTPYIGGLSVDISNLNYRELSEKLKNFCIDIRPQNPENREKTWYDEFSVIEFMDYLSTGSKKRGRRIFESADTGLVKSIDLKQKYFKSSNFKRYIVSTDISEEGAWRLPNGRRFPKERPPHILLKIDPEYD